MARRIVVVGAGGKTTLARRLAEKMGVPHIELDDLHWEPGWKEAELEVFRSRVSQRLQHDGFVIDGNYSKVQDLTLGQADTIVWVDYPLPLVVWRTLKRTIRRSLSGEKLWTSGNRERIRYLFTKDSLILWHLQTHRKRRKRYEEMLATKWSHLNLVRLKGPSQAEAWLAGIQGITADYSPDAKHRRTP